MADELRQKPGGSDNRILKLVSEVVAGDVLLLDFAKHMDTQPHTVLAVDTNEGLFGGGCRRFRVRCCGEEFTTFDMGDTMHVDVQLPEKEGQDAEN